MGTVYKVSSEGKYSTIVSFHGKNGAHPQAGLAAGDDGNLYGTTSYGGVSNAGTVFKLTPDGVLSTVAVFGTSNARRPTGELVLGADGSLYGTTSEGGPNAAGTVYKVTKSGTITILITFNHVLGAYPSGGLVLGSDGNFYGTAAGGGAEGYGTFFKITPAGAFTLLASFRFETGIYPSSKLVEVGNGTFYGTTTGQTGPISGSSVYRVTSAGLITRLATFNSTNGYDALGGLTPAADSSGALYGTTALGGTNNLGTVYKVTPNGGLTVVFSFSGKNGAHPRGGLIMGSDGYFYGTTSGKGNGISTGTVFKMTLSGALTTLAVSGAGAGTSPAAALVEASDGSFYGTIYGGGDGDGSVFKVTPEGNFTSLAAFNQVNGSNPRAALVEGSDGNLYGTTESGGASGHGSVFKLSPTGDITTIASFFPYMGSGPRAALIEGIDGSFYGTTPSGGTYNYGVIFKVTPSGVITVLVNFTGVNGLAPQAALVRGRDGAFYGTTSGGGANGVGTVFRVTPQGELTTLASFKQALGANPRTSLVEDSAGNFYGTTSAGGESTRGTVFKVTPAGELTTLVSFDYSTPTGPAPGLSLGADGNLYGASAEGGDHGFGKVFKVTMDGMLTTLHSFDGTTATRPEGTPIFGSDGHLYGTAGKMVVWRMAIPMTPGGATTPHSAITRTSVTLGGIVNASGEDTAVTFEYGLTPALGSSVVASPELVTGRSATAVSAVLSDLALNTSYFYRLSASNANGSFSTPIGSFTTASNIPPTAADDSFAPDPGTIGARALAVLGNDSDAEGDLLTITAVTQGSYGAVSTDGEVLTYTPRSGFLGRDSFTYTISDGIETAVALVELRANVSFNRMIHSEGSEVPNAGEEGSGTPAGARFQRFGMPSINSIGKLAFMAGYTAQADAGGLSIFAFDPQSEKGWMAARQGQIAPGTGGAHFASFNDPLLNEEGDLAFLATLSSGDVTKSNNRGLWVHANTAGSGQDLELVARSGAQASGAPAGARWKRFTSVALSSAQIGVAPERSWMLAFTGYLTQGFGGVKAGNDMGLWIASAVGTKLALREGQKLGIGAAEKTVRTFAALKPMPGMAGHGNGLSSPGAVAVQAFFSDDTQAVVVVSIDEVTGEVLLQTIALPGDLVGGSTETVAKFGLPGQSDTGATIAWLGTMSGKVDRNAIFERNLDADSVRLLARRGTPTPGITGATFHSFQGVAVQDDGSALFHGRVSGRGISNNNDWGLWWRSRGAKENSFTLLAMEGAQPPGVPDGASWAEFTSIGLPAAEGGPLFTARMVAGSKRKPGPGGVTNDDDQGLWAVDSLGELRLLVREGEAVVAGTDDERKTVKGFSVLTAVTGSPMQRRSFDAAGRIAYLADFTDGSQAVMQVQLP